MPKVKMVVVEKNTDPNFSEPESLPVELAVETLRLLGRVITFVIEAHGVIRESYDPKTDTRRVIYPYKTISELRGLTYFSARHYPERSWPNGEVTPGSIHAWMEDRDQGLTSAVILSEAGELFVRQTPSGDYGRLSGEDLDEMKSFETLKELAGLLIDNLSADTEDNLALAA